MYKNMIGDLDFLPEKDKSRMAAMIEQLQVRDRRKDLDKHVAACVRRCAEKFLKHSKRVGIRFAELNSGAATQD